MDEVSRYLQINRGAWTRANAEYTDGRAIEAWSEQEIGWGVWDTPESTARVLPDVAGKDVIELGCGTAYFSWWLKRLGARTVVGVDVTPAQLTTARRMNERFNAGLQFVEANAELVPIAAESFDVAVSEYGASIWCDPYKWIPEAARLLRPGGELIFLRNSTLSMLCADEHGKVGTQLLRPQRGLHAVEWTDDEPGVEFHLGHGDLFRVLRDAGFDVLDLIELYASDDAGNHKRYDSVSAEWARAWPAEELWRARKR